MGSRMGYEYRYRFWMDDSMIPRYSLYNLKPEIKFVFENRTYFVVKRSDGGGGDEIIDSERHETGAEEDIDEFGLESLLSLRLEEYWMSPDEVRDFVRKALAFAREKEADPQHASLRFIPIAIELDVRTVQKVGEPIGDAFDRAIRSQHLYPTSLIEDDNLVEVEGFVDSKFLAYLRQELCTYRVEDANDALRYMEACPLCSRRPTIGARIAMLDDCCHYFHYHCVFEWLLKNNKSCPTCGHQISYCYNDIYQI